MLAIWCAILTTNLRWLLSSVGRYKTFRALADAAGSGHVHEVADLDAGQGGHDFPVVANGVRALAQPVGVSHDYRLADLLGAVEGRVPCDAGDVEPCEVAMAHHPLRCELVE